MRITRTTVHDPTHPLVYPRLRKTVRNVDIANPVLLGLQVLLLVWLVILWVLLFTSTRVRTYAKQEVRVTR
jgi:hypothetical protein